MTFEYCLISVSPIYLVLAKISSASEGKTINSTADHLKDHWDGALYITLTFLNRTTLSPSTLLAEKTSALEEIPNGRSSVAAANSRKTLAASLLAS